MKHAWVYEIAAEPIANLRAAGISGSIPRAENFETGQTVGKRDPGPWIENILDLLDRARELPRVMAGGKR